MRMGAAMLDLAKKVLVSVVATVLLTVSPARAAAVEVTLGADDFYLHVGETTTISVTGRIQWPAGEDDGIGTFNVDLILNDTSVLSIVPGSVSRPDTYAGSDGSPMPFGLDAVTGAYFARSYGVYGPRTLFTVDVQALASGSCLVAVGPDYTWGADFVLWESGSIPGFYSAGSTIHVVPEPATSSLLALSALALLRRRRRRGRG